MKVETTVKAITFSLFLVVTFLMCSVSGAGSTSVEKATEQECLAKAAEAVSLIQEIGDEAAMKKIMDKNGPFVWKDTHVYCVDSENGFIKAHPRPSAMGFSLRFYRDAFGDNPYDIVIDNIKANSEGWITYVTDQMGRGTPKLKRMHYRKVPGANIIVCSGYYPTI